jgi:hypothetical protein
VQHWADGGKTKLSNLILLCTTHHRLVHEGGFRVLVDRDGRSLFSGRLGECFLLCRPRQSWLRMQSRRACVRTVSWVSKSIRGRLRQNGVANSWMWSSRC